MTSIPQEELLSALLDGELSAEEEARVRAWVAENPAAQQLLEELRAVRTTLHALPQYKLEADFSQQVLRRAEREMLTGNSTSHADGHRAAGSDEGAAVFLQMGRPTVQFNWSRMARPAMWSGLAVAAALMLMFLLPNQLAEHKVAMTQAPGTATTATANKALDSEPALAKGSIPRNRLPSDAIGRQAGQSALGVADGRADMTGKLQTGKLQTGKLQTGKLQAGNFYYQSQRAPIDQYETNVARLKDQSPAALVVVQVAVMPEAARSKRFDQILMQNDIHIAEESERGVTDVDGDALPLQMQRDKLAESPATDVLYVEATEAQLDATLADLALLPEDFVNVVVAEDARGAAGDGWEYTNNGAYSLPPVIMEAPSLDAEAPRPNELGEVEDRQGGAAQREPQQQDAAQQMPAVQAPPLSDLEQQKEAQDEGLRRLQEKKQESVRNFSRAGTAQRYAIPAPLADGVSEPNKPEAAAIEPAQQATPAPAAAPAETPAAEAAPMDLHGQPAAVNAPQEPAASEPQTVRRVLFVLQVMPRNVMNPAAPQPQSIAPPVPAKSGAQQPE